ncbi:MAG: SLOG family protein [Sporolactobacillus sp.]
MACSSILISGYTARELGVYAANHPGIPTIRYCLRKRILDSFESGTEWFVISGQAGVELWAGQCVLALQQEQNLPVKLAVLPPFRDQENRYTDWMNKVDMSILGAADFLSPISTRPYERPLQLIQKNAFLVAHTEGMLLLYDEDMPGSPKYYLSEARKRAARDNYPISLIDRYDLEEAAEDERQQDPNYWS